MESQSMFQFHGVRVYMTDSVLLNIILILFQQLFLKNVGKRVVWFLYRQNSLINRTPDTIRALSCKHTYYTSIIIECYK